MRSHKIEVWNLRKACGVVKYRVRRFRKACGVVKYKVWKLREVCGVIKYKVWRRGRLLGRDLGVRLKTHTVPAAGPLIKNPMLDS